MAEQAEIKTEDSLEQNTCNRRINKLEDKTEQILIATTVIKNDLTWLKWLYGIFSIIITVLLTVLITIK